MFFVSAGRFTHWPTYLTFLDDLADGFRAGHLHFAIEPPAGAAGEAEPVRSRPGSRSGTGTPASTTATTTSTGARSRRCCWRPGRRCSACTRASATSTSCSRSPACRRSPGCCSSIASQRRLFPALPGFLRRAGGRRVRLRQPDALQPVARGRLRGGDRRRPRLPDRRPAVRVPRADHRRTVADASRRGRRRAAWRWRASAGRWRSAAGCRSRPASRCWSPRPAGCWPRRARPSAGGCGRRRSPGWARRSRSASALLLTYNKLRFDAWFDFGRHYQLSWIRFGSSPRVPARQRSGATRCGRSALELHLPVPHRRHRHGRARAPVAGSTRPDGYIVYEPVVGCLLALPWAWLAPVTAVAARPPRSGRSAAAAPSPTRAAVALAWLAIATTVAAAGALPRPAVAVLGDDALPRATPRPR